MRTTNRPKFSNFKKKSFQNKEVKKEYEALESIFESKKKTINTYMKAMQNIKSGKFISLKSATDIDNHINELKANYEQQKKN